MFLLFNIMISSFVPKTAKEAGKLIEVKKSQHAIGNIFHFTK